MDKRTILALVLIGVLFAVWSYFNAVNAPKPEAAVEGNKRLDTTARADTLPVAKPVAPALPPEKRLPAEYLGLLAGNETFTEIESPLYKVILSSHGGLIYRFELKKYKTWYGAPVQLINDSTGFPGVFDVSFTQPDGKEVTTGDLHFDIEGPAKISLGENDSAVVVARLTIPDTSSATPRSVEKRFVFRGSSYGVGVTVAMNNLTDRIAGGVYRLNWRDGVKYQEHNSVDESGKAKAVVMINDEFTDFDAHEAGVPKKEHFTGTIDWVGTHVKYFGAAIIPEKPIANGRVDLSGVAHNADSNGIFEVYNVSLSVPISTASTTQSFTLFAGPLDYKVAQEFGLQSMVELGARFLIRPIGEYLLLPVLRFLHSFIGNYGLVIIVFSILIRGILWPLSVPQIRSSRKMQLLQPKIAELREKYKDDSQKQQTETMTLYREYGINPVGGCLPMLLQMPILYALWGTLGSAIELRQAGFALWIHDLSVPDFVIHLPFTAPLLGSQLSGMALIMGVTLFIQQKMMLTDPKQKAMVYMMPVLLTLMFNYLPSGLNLYYLTFNILSIGQQIYLTKYSKNTMTLDQMRAVAKTKKKGWLSQKMEEAQKMAEAQKKMGSSGGSRAVDGRTPVEPRRKS
jgi:YidC/Oxa1 family membrane protein insertase